MTELNCESEVTQSRLTLCDPMDCIAYQAPQSMEFSRHEYWSGLLFPPPGDPPSSGIEPMSLASPALVGGFFITESPGKPISAVCVCIYISPPS